MNIRIADQRDFTEVMSFYDAMCRELGKRDFLHAGNQGGYPSADMVRAAIHESGLIIGEEQGKIHAGTVVEAGVVGLRNQSVDLPTPCLVARH